MLNKHHARLCLPFKGPGAVFRGPPLEISGTIQPHPMKCCKVIVLLKAYQNTKRNFRNLTSNVTMTSLRKTMGKFGPHRNQANYILLER